MTLCPWSPHLRFTEEKLRPWEGNTRSGGAERSWQNAWTRAPDFRSGEASGSVPAAYPGWGLVSLGGQMQTPTPSSPEPARSGSGCGMRERLSCWELGAWEGCCGNGHRVAGVWVRWGQLGQQEPQFRLQPGGCWDGQVLCSETSVGS